jgi:predicted nucleotidyltransferase
MITNQIIDEVKNRLVRVYDPLEIYLFGSYAWGSPDEDSDLDLCVVIEAYKKGHHDTVVDGHKALIGMRVAKDIVVFDKKEFEQQTRASSSLGYKIFKKGKKIYAKA